MFVPLWRGEDLPLLDISSFCLGFQIGLDWQRFMHGGLEQIQAAEWQYGRYREPIVDDNYEVASLIFHHHDGCGMWRRIELTTWLKLFSSILNLSRTSEWMVWRQYMHAVSWLCLKVLNPWFGTQIMRQIGTNLTSNSSQERMLQNIIPEMSHVRSSRSKINKFTGEPQRD